jgi:transcriptional regulator with XRE-family HTH domain
MIDTTRCFFDSLPVHPQPEQMESFTGYLTRLGEANRMGTIGELVITAFPNTSYQPSDAVKMLNDYSTLSFGTLPITAACSENALRATTLLHLGKKFGRLSHPQALGGFFQGSVASHRRYCPLCLAECSRPYYSLVWQFLCIPGCIRHGCHFLEECGHCRHKLPLLPSHPSIVFCPNCREDLRTLMPPLLSVEESQVAVTRTHDITFLITPHQGEEIQERAKFIGMQLAHLRRMRGQSPSQVAVHLQTNRRRIGGLEQGDTRRGVIFRDYIAYVDYLGISLKALYEASLFEQNRSHILEEEWVERVKTAIHKLESLDKPITYRAISEIVGATREHLGNLPRVKALLDAYQMEHQRGKLQRFQQRQKEILEQAQAAIDHLESLGEPITQQAISDFIGLSRTYLREYLRGTPLLQKTVKEDYYDDGTRRVHWRENELVELVQATIQELQSLGEPITRKTVAQKIGMSQPGLYRYASIRELVKEYTRPSQRGQREVELVEQVQTAIKSLTSQGKPIGYQSVSQMIGVSKRILRRHLPVRTVLDETIEHASQGQYAVEVVALVQAAIERLESQGEVVSYQSVSKIVDISQWVLQRQLRVRALLEDAKEKQQSEVEVMARVQAALETLTFSGEPIGYQTVGKTTKLPQKVLIRYRSVRELIEENTNDQQREVEVLVKVHAAIQALESLGESITLRNICKHAHLTTYTLKSYPRVRELLEQFFHAQRDEQAREFQQKEDELVRRVQIAIQMLNSLNKPVTSRNLSEVIGAHYENLKRYPRVKTLLEKVMEDCLQQRGQKKQQRGEELAGQVQTAIQELMALGIPVTQIAISQKVGLSLCALKQYPLVKKIIAPIGEHNRRNRKRSVQ